MITTWKNMTDYFNGKALRERMIISLLVLAVVYAAFDFLVFASIASKHQELRLKLQAAQSKAQQMQTQESVLTAAMSQDPNAGKKRQVKQLRTRLDAIDENLQQLSLGLMPAHELPQALHDVLDAVGSLTLSSMITKESEKLTLVVDSGTPSADDEYPEPLADDQMQAEDIGVYKHAVVVALEGRYFDVLAYLQALESLSWKLYWETLDYQVEHFPNARITIEVYTMSTEAGVLGV